MISAQKPYLVIPKLIEQSTWGGTYIATLKNWHNQTYLQNKKIGQSYELFGESKLALTITDSADQQFSGELGGADSPDGSLTDYLKQNSVQLNVILESNADFIGRRVCEKFQKMPLLIKINQAAGNSFQLHIKSSQKHPRWQPKPESWYYLEDGFVSCGIKPGIDITTYKNICHQINTTMQQLSNNVKIKKITLESAKKEATEFIKKLNPWQYVQLHKTKKYDLIDLSLGGVHHSWEEHPDLPLGNIVYEVQLDVMDPFCTIRGFDQGKFKDDGSIREIHVDDYFQFIDTDPTHNDISNLRKVPHGDNLLATPYYSLDVLNVTDVLQQQITDSFHHLYVREGKVMIKTTAGSVTISTGHSCFVPAAAQSYTVTPLMANSVILKTHIEL